MKKHLLLTGASGFIGWHFQEILSKYYKVFAQYNKNKLIKKCCSPVQIDLQHYKTLQSSFKKIKPSVVIHTAALASIWECENNPEMAFCINRDATALMAELCNGIGAKFIFFSTDVVFDGKKGGYVETDDVNPLNVYGASKAEAESIIDKKADDYLILRISLSYALKNAVHKCFVDDIINSLRQGETLNLYTDQIRCPGFVEDTAVITLRLLSENKKGIFHCSGPEPLSRYEIGKIIANTFSYSMKHINPVRVEEYLLPFKNGMNCSLNNEKTYNATGHRSMSFSEGIKLFNYDIQGELQ